ncbi:MAG: hydrogenase iron-sulfur subunit [Thermoplasmata archaeon]|nr:MAG: hydrogenase iron-sulfur subunit [Thermoplasmata archaeon]
MAKFEPKILAFACNWCSYAGADLAGVSRMQYPPNMRIIRVMCSGRVDPIFILDALAKGVDGVMVLGCHPGDCHYISGNLMAEKKMRWVADLIEKAGVNPQRLRLEWISASEGERFANTVKDFTNQIRELGPIRGKEQKGISAELQAAEKVASDSRVRILLGKERELLEEGNVYGEKKSQDEFDELMRNILDAEHTRSKILLLAKDEPKSVKEISEKLDIPSWEVGKHVMWLRHKGKMALSRIDDRSPKYITVEVVG